MPKNQHNFNPDKQKKPIPSSGTSLYSTSSGHNSRVQSNSDITALFWCRFLGDKQTLNPHETGFTTVNSIRTKKNGKERLEYWSDAIKIFSNHVITMVI